MNLKGYHLMKYLVTLALWAALVAPGFAGVDVVDCWYRADRDFPEYAHMWTNVAEKEAAEMGEHAGPQPLAGSFHLYVKNSGPSAVAVDDVVVEGISLKRAIASNGIKEGQTAGAASVYFSDLTTAERDAFRRVGSPIWWKADPRSISPGGFAEIAVRMRFKPDVVKPELEVRLSDGSSVKAQMVAQDTRPRIMGISYSPTLDAVNIYIERPAGAADAPAKLLIDGSDVTANSVISHDPGFDMDVISTKLGGPSARASFHLFQCLYHKSGMASAAVRAWDDEPAYGIWGGKPVEEHDVQLAKAYLQEIAEHGVNVQMEMIGSAGVMELLKTDEGQQLMASLGIMRAVNEPGKGRTKRPYAYFLEDEPDAKDFYVNGIPAHERVGSMIPSLLDEAERNRSIDPLTPNFVNVDMTFKPNNYYVYGQMGDFLATDPYYQPRIFQSFKESPSLIGLYSKAIFPLASAALAQSACAPRPLHIILFSTRGGRVTRFPTPTEKRIEAYYCLGVGAKGLSYWWYTPGEKAQGCGSDDPDARALWKEIGLIGAEFQTLSPLLAQSCPADVPMKLSPQLWARTLLAGKESMILVVVNDDYACDRLGASYKPIDNAIVEVQLPSWLVPKEAFEISYTGTRDVEWDAADAKLKLGLGKLELTRLIVISADSGLRERLQQRYTQRCSANVARLQAQGEE